MNNWVQQSNSRNNRPRNEQIAYEENKNGGDMLDFSNAFTKGGGKGNRTAFGNKPRLNGRSVLGSRTITERSKISGNNTKRLKTGTPMVKMTKAMEMRMKANMEKQNKINR
jgi:hypothetical protein